MRLESGLHIHVELTGERFVMSVMSIRRVLASGLNRYGSVNQNELSTVCGIAFYLIDEIVRRVG